MDDLLREFLTETGENLDTIDVELVRFEHDPNNAAILGNLFRLVHTIKGTCGFLGLPRLEALTHAAEALLERFRDGRTVTGEAVALILATIDRIKLTLTALEAREREPEGGDGELIAALAAMTASTDAAAASVAAAKAEPQERDALPRTGEHFAGAAPAADEAPPAAAVAAPETEAELPLPQAAPVQGQGPHRCDGETRSAVAGQSIRVPVDILETLMTMVSELVLTRNQLLEIGRCHEDSAFKAPLQRLAAITAELQEGVMKTRMQPIGHVWQKLPRLVRDLSADLGKSIAIQMHGAETELDRQVLELIRDPLVHMVRNAADHAIETPAERRAAGKPETGLIRLSAVHESGQIVVEVSDDGRGFDCAKIKEKARALGLVPAADLERMTDAQLHQMVFMPGFSTADRISAISGRGIGMDVVKNNIEQIHGTIDVTSVPGAGSSFVIRIPLTLAIINALVVAAAGERFAIPQFAVVELLHAGPNGEHRIESISNTAVLRWRNRLLPLIDLCGLLRIEGAAEPEDRFIVVAKAGSQVFGMLVDEVLRTEEIVVKPVSAALRPIGLFCGTTILGDGSVIMILDPDGVARTLAGEVPDTQRRQEPDADGAAGDDERKATPVLVFRAGSTEPKAVPLSLVARLEKIDCGWIEVANGRELVQYRGKLMPLVRASEKMRLRTDGTQPLLVFADGDRAMGLMVDEIIDIVEEPFEIEVASHAEGILGSAVIRGRATDILDIGHFLPLADQDWFRRPRAAAKAPSPRVLLVDDSAFFRDLLTPVLQAAGFAVTGAAAPGEALRLAREQRFDAIVLDIDLPEMTGFDLAAALGADRHNAGTPIVALASYASADMIERGRAVGFHDFVAKFDRAGLVAALKETAFGQEQAA